MENDILQESQEQVSLETTAELDTPVTEVPAEETLTESEIPEVLPTEEAAEPSEVAEELPTEEAQPEDQAPVPESPKGLKLLIRKWWFWAIIAVAVIAIVTVISQTSGSGSSGSSSGSSVASYINPYVQIVKTTENSNYGITYGAAFDRFFTNPKWSYFSASTGEDVVEFEGGFLFDGNKATATVQFVVNTDEGYLEVYHLSINGVGQSRLLLSTLVQKVFESY